MGAALYFMSFKIVRRLRPCLLCALSVLGLGGGLPPAAADMTSPAATTGGVAQAAQDPQQTSSWSTHGGLSQFYRINASGGGGQDSEIDTDVDLTTQFIGDDYRLQGHLIGGYVGGPVDSGFDDPLHISSLYLDAAASDGRSEARLRRQAPEGGGVLGPFDGLFLSRQIEPGLRLNLVGGFPMDNSAKVITGTRLYGVNADLGTVGKGWDFNTFAIEQFSGHLLDRRAVGGQARYSGPQGSVMGLVDYDVSYRTLNLLLLTGNLHLPDHTEIDVTYNQRKGPILTTSNALIGQADSSLTALSQHYTEDQIRQLARDRSADSRSFTIGAVHPISERLQVGGDITSSSVSATPASGGVAATAADDADWSYGLHLMGKDLLKHGDGALVDLHHETHLGCDNWSLNLDTRYPISRTWYVNPVVHLERQHVSGESGNWWSLMPTLRINHLVRLNLNLEVEVGGQWRRGGGASTSPGYYLSVGYQMNF